MSSIINAIGLKTGSDSSNLAPYYTMFHFLFAYVALSARAAKGIAKIDHNVNPREDVTKYGERAVAEGKITQRQLNFIKRNESCHANSMEHFPLFVSAALFATVAAVKNTEINGACALYTAARVGYAAAFLLIERHRFTWVRSLAWWTSNFACLYLLWAAGKNLNRLS